MIAQNNRKSTYKENCNLISDPNIPLVISVLLGEILATLSPCVFLYNGSPD